jgi:hypothetical protein
LLQLYTLRGHHGYCVGARECEMGWIPELPIRPIK